MHGGRGASLLYQYAAKCITIPERVIYISKITVRYLEPRSLFIAPPPLLYTLLIQRHHPAWKVPLAGSLKRRSKGPALGQWWLRWRGVGGAGTHSILNLAGGAGSSARRAREPDLRHALKGWLGLGIREAKEKPSNSQRPLLVSARTQMHPDVLTRPRIAVSAKHFTTALRAPQTPPALARARLARTHTHKFHPPSFKDLNHHLCLICPRSLSAVSASFDVAISKQ